MNNKHQINSLTIANMQASARKLAKTLKPGDVILLEGEVGAGKTTFARALIEEISIEPCEVTSPTFNLMQSYDVKDANGKYATLWHLDLYRLKSSQEAQELGLDDIWQHIVLIEWAEIIEDLIPPNYIKIKIDLGANAEQRSLTIIYPQ
ncbi:MAG: tRNA (adenosine(37)-N6)-threonylcarbamoyltransferase complex ATPase subunit type 1 TsaE [Pseudomonadota bacterium]